MYGSDLRDAYLRSLKVSQKSDKTIKTYSNAIDLFGRFQFSKNRTLYNAETEHFEEYLCALHERNLSPRTMRLYTVSVRTFYKCAFSRNKVSVDPCVQLDSPKFATSVPRIPQWEDYIKLISFPLQRENDYRDRAMIMVLFSSGLRISELCSLRFNSINLDTGEFSVIGKGNKERDGFVSGDALEALRYWIDLHKSKNAVSESRTLFMTLHHTPISLNAVRRTIYARCIQMGVQQYRQYDSGVRKSLFHAHEFRHLHATQMLRAGVPLPIIQKSLGHSSIETTAIYLHVDTEQLRGAHRRRNEFERRDPPPAGPSPLLPFQPRTHVA